MIWPESANKNPLDNLEEQQKNIPELLATILAFVGVFIFLVKILFL